MEKNKTEIIAQITALLSQLVENEDNKQNESAAVSAKAPFEMLTIKKMRRSSNRIIGAYYTSACGAGEDSVYPNR